MVLRHRLEIPELISCRYLNWKDQMVCEWVKWRAGTDLTFSQGDPPLE
jgi:hypothetical protein